MPVRYFAAKPAVLSMGLGMLYILIGGVIYTAGAVLYGVGKKKSVYHTVFHILVDVACVIHAYAILAYAL